MKFFTNEIADRLKARIRSKLEGTQFQPKEGWIIKGGLEMLPGPDSLSEVLPAVLIKPTELIINPESTEANEQYKFRIFCVREFIENEEIFAQSVNFAETVASIIGGYPYLGNPGWDDGRVTNVSVDAIIFDFMRPEDLYILRLAANAIASVVELTVSVATTG